MRACRITINIRTSETIAGRVPAKRGVCVKINKHRSVERRNIASKNCDSDNSVFPGHAIVVGLTPCPPNFNVGVQASRALLALAMI